MKNSNLMKKYLLILSVILIAGYAVYYFSKKINFNPNREVGEVVDSLNGVKVYYNGGVNHVEERHTKDGYNLGLKYQCVEFVKRYYYERFNHKMPDAYGHAKDFYDKNISDGELNPQRNLIQCNNPSISKPAAEDLLVFSGSLTNRYGHVAIVSAVSDDEVEIIQQNPGPFSSSREAFTLSKNDGKWQIENDRILGWLRKK